MSYCHEGFDLDDVGVLATRTPGRPKWSSRSAALASSMPRSARAGADTVAAFIGERSSAPAA